MSTFGEGSQGGEETAGGDHQQHSMGQIRDCWEDRSASQDVKMNGTIEVSILVQQLRHCLTTQACALKMNTEITLDQPDQHWQSFEERLFTMAWKRGDYCMNGTSRKRGQGDWPC